MKGGSRGLFASIMVILVLLIVGLFSAGSFEPQDHGSEDRIGTWYTVTSFEADVVKGVITSTGHIPGDGSVEITISRTGDGLFMGSFDGRPVQGGLSDDRLEFSYYYPSLGYTVQFDGRFIQDDLLYGVITSYRWSSEGSVSTVLMSRSDSFVSIDPPEFPEVYGATGLGGTLFSSGETVSIAPADILVSDVSGGLVFAFMDLGNGRTVPLYMAYLGADPDGCVYGKATYHDSDRRYVVDFTMSSDTLTFRSFTNSDGSVAVAVSSFTVDYPEGRAHDVPDTGERYTIDVSMVDSSGILQKDRYALKVTGSLADGTIIVMEDTMGLGVLCAVLISPVSDGCHVSAAVIVPGMKTIHLDGTMDVDGDMTFIGSSMGEVGMSVILTREG